MDPISITAKLDVKSGAKQLFSGTLPDLQVDVLDSPVQIMVPAGTGAPASPPPASPPPAPAPKPGATTPAPAKTPPPKATTPGTKTVSIQQDATDKVVFLLIASDQPQYVSYQLANPADAASPATVKPADPPAKPAADPSKAEGGSPDAANAAAEVLAASTTKPTAASADSAWRELEYPHILLGHGAVKLLDENPTGLTFQNYNLVPATVTIHIGRCTPKAATSNSAALKPG